MNTRVTLKQLQSITDRINSLTSSPTQQYVRDEETGRYTPQAGCYHLSQAYGGIALHRMSMTPGCTGVSDPLGRGHMTKRELAELMYAFIRGIEASENNTE